MRAVKWIAYRGHHGGSRHSRARKTFTSTSSQGAALEGSDRRMRRLLLVVLLAACGRSMHVGGGVGPDAASADAAPDASADAGSTADGASDSDGGLAPTDVQVLVRDGFAPIANVRVLFDGTDGTHTELATDATGAAAAPLPNGGEVTVIRTYPTAASPAAQQYPEIYNYLGVKPGEVLHVGHEVDTTTAPTPITVTVPGVAQGTVQIVTPCGTGQGTPPTVTVQVGACPPMLAFYLVDSTQYGFATKVPYATSIDFTNEVMAEPLSTTVLTYDLTSDVSSVTGEARAMDGTHALYSTGVIRVDQGSKQIEMPNLADAIDELVVGTRTATAGGTQIVGTRYLWEPMPVSIDAASAYPYIRQPATFTPTTITWTEDGGTAPVDAVLATIDVTRGGPTASPADAKYRRTIIAPHGGTSLAIPQLTGADATYNPGPNDQLAGAVGVVGATAGYDALVPWAFGVSNIVEATTRGNSVTLSYAGATPPTL